MQNKLTFIDLFAGCGGLSEGFVQAGFVPLVHVEMDKAACYSLKTRMAFHYLVKNNKSYIYSAYLSGEITRDVFYKSIPKEILDSVIEAKIAADTLQDIFARMDVIIGKEKLDLIVGGPPCQAYSLVGRARSSDGMLGDERNWLFQFYIEFLKRYKPKYFVFENVVGLLSAKDKGGTKYFDLMLEGFDKAGYRVVSHVVSANEYGVPQNRRRVIILGTRKDLNPIELHLKPRNLKATIKQILGDLPPIKSGDKTHKVVKAKKGCAVLYGELGIKDGFPITLHKARPHNSQDLEIYRIAISKWNSGHERLNYNHLPSRLQTHNNKSAFIDRFKVVAGDLYSSHTVVAHISRDGHYYIHYDAAQNRSLTPREAARLQTFPDNYYFESSDGKEHLACAFKQIGNAVPVYLARQIAESIKEDITDEKN